MEVTIPLNRSKRWKPAVSYAEARAIAVVDGIKVKHREPR
jgi:hypothetical protein